MSVNLLIIFFVLVVVAMIAFILVQKGAGATAGSAFGSGASATVFGAKGSGNFLTKTTMLLAFLFFAISMYMAVQASKEFTTPDDGKVDLGVFGTVDTSKSDVPEMKPAENDKSNTNNSDVPQVKVEQQETASDVPTVSQSTDAETSLSQEAKNKANAVKDMMTEKVEQVKDEAAEKLDATKDKIIEKASQKVEEAKQQVEDKIDG